MAFLKQSTCVTKVQLGISCTNLLDRDVTSKSDPLCVVLIEDPKSKLWNEVNDCELDFQLVV